MKMGELPTSTPEGDQSAKSNAVQKPFEAPPVLVSSPSTSGLLTPIDRLSKSRVILAFAIAGISDLISIWVELMPPLQWTIDLTTALLLFAVMGWRWLILPGLIAEAIPGLGLFPTWILVVASIAAWGKLTGGPSNRS
jgi:hypothetical protein